MTNDHFDEDGLIGLFCMIEPIFAEENRELLIDASRSGGFGTYGGRRAARLAFAISSLVDPVMSPWNPDLSGPDFFSNYPRYCTIV